MEDIVRLPDEGEAATNFLFESFVEDNLRLPDEELRTEEDVLEDPLSGDSREEVGCRLRLSTETDLQPEVE